MSKIKDENYYQISGWMLNRLNLKGTELQVFAIIYGFSQDGESLFTGSLNYLSDWLGTSRPTTIKALKGLTEKKVILKDTLVVNGVTFNRYKANLEMITIFRGGKETLPPVKDFDGGSKETLPPGSKETLQGGSKETLPNNKSLDNKSLDNKDNNNISIEPPKKEKVPTSGKVDTKTLMEQFDLLWTLYPKGRKQGKEVARKAFIKAIESGVSFDDIKNGLEAYTKHIEICKIETKYIAMAQTWFNQKRWEDEYDIPVPADSGDERFGVWL